MTTLLTLLEQYGDQGAAQYVFKQELGEDFEKLLSQRFLNQTSHFIRSFSIKDRFGCLVSYQVVEHSPTDVIGVAEDHDDLQLSRVDTLIVRVNTDALCRSLGGACGFDPQLVTQGVHPKLHLMGKATFPRRGPVFACFSNHPDTMLDAIIHITREGHKEANLFILSRSVATAAVRQLALRNHCELLYMADHFDFHADRGFVAKDRQHLPLFQDGTAVDRWPLAFPEKSVWKDVRMRFPHGSDQSVHIQFGSSGRLFEFREISQFVDNRSGKPNKQWALLRVLAKYSGTIPRITRGRKDAGKETAVDKEKGWRELEVPPMTMLTMRHEDVRAIENSEFRFIPQERKGTLPEGVNA